MERERVRRGGFLAFFGLETADKASETVFWALPYLGILVAGLVFLSWLVHKLNPLPGWVYAAAIFLAIVYFFFFLARVRQMGLDAQDGAAPGPK